MSDESLPQLFDNVADFVQRVADQHGYVARRCALGVHIGKQIYVDFQIFVKCARRSGRRKRLSLDRGDEKNGTIDYTQPHHAQPFIPTPSVYSLSFSVSQSVYLILQIGQ